MLRGARGSPDRGVGLEVYQRRPRKQKPSSHSKGSADSCPKPSLLRKSYDIMSQSVLPGLPGFNPDDLQPWTVSVVVSMTILALTSVGVRLISRRIKGQPLWWDDYMILFSMVSHRSESTTTECNS
jgi:hypothetical protein